MMASKEASKTCFYVVKVYVKEESGSWNGTGLNDRGVSYYSIQQLQEQFKEINQNDVVSNKERTITSTIQLNNSNPI